MAGVRGAHAASMDEIANPLYWGFRTYARQCEFPETDWDGMFDRFHDYMIANAKYVKSRAFSFGTPSAGGGNVGTGQMFRVTKDEDNLDIESQTADDKIVRCIGDRQSGEPLAQELFEIYGETRLRDDIQVTGSGERGRIRCLSPVVSSERFGNTSFDNFSGTAAVPTAISDWVLTTGPIGTTVIFDGTNYHTTFEGAGTPYSLKFLANETLTQYFSTKRATFDPKVPVCVGVYYNRQVGSGDGTLTLTFGAKSVAVVLAAQTGWNFLKIAMDDDVWLKNFNGTAPVLSIALSGRTTGYVLIDTLIVGDCSYFDGGWNAIVCGATPFKRLDVYTYSDTETGAKNQMAFARLTKRATGRPRYLPHASGGAVTWADPS